MGAAIRAKDTLLEARFSRSMAPAVEDESGEITQPNCHGYGELMFPGKLCRHV
ncbi:MAG: hypothetical protein CM15mP120_01570 [Pseudomonadota bacterium]|nr:MAG: hypothetical protein CM15mP120_01570 [Pseudomonadota bacterium]